MAGVALMVGAAFAFSIMSLLVKWVGRHLSSQEIVLVRGLVTLAVSWASLRAAGVSPGGARKGALALRGVFGFAAVSAFFYAVIHLPLADATVIHYTNPAFTAAFAAVVLAEPIRARDAVSLVASLAGVVLIARPTFLFGGEPLDPFGVGVALLGAALSAAAYVVVRDLRRTEHPLVIVFWFGLVSTLGSVPGTAVDFRLPTGVLWLGLIGVGLATQIGQVWLTRGLALVPAGRAMTLGYVQIVFAAVWGALFFGERPSLGTYLGAALILGSTLALARPARPRPT